MKIINIDNMTMMYNAKKGIKNINLNIETGVCFGILGPSGSGKSTLMRTLLGFVKINEGVLKINNIDVWGNSHKTNDLISFIPGEPIIPLEGTGKEYLKFYAKLRPNSDLDKMDKLINYFDLDADSPIKKMSKGMKQKVAIIACLMVDSEIYLFDEPTSGLDPVMQKKFVNIVKELKEQGKTIILSSHIMSEVDELCDEFAILKRGEIIYANDIKSIRKENKDIEKVFWEAYEIKTYEEEYKND
ncbi:ABC transporter ATP-binding protein [Spiroplasma endosymbiont of Crioceris asparagi]|uniref:ABC transporter ATP-binding protein n=1 Tax=Spiroplasma endosymbiont of Crioceris asparagi TaxID=3066286 RepID=UPI0030CEC7CE